MTPLSLRSLARLRLLAALLLTGACAVQAAPVRTERVEAELFAERAAAAPGKAATVGLRLRMDEHWHTYWRNPGDSGLPTKIHWNLPEGWVAGPIQWPYPQAQRVGPLMNYGYSDEVMLLVDLTPPADARPGPVAITADANWLVCEDVCIPEKATLALDFAVASSEPDATSASASRFADARARLPDTPAGWSTQSALDGNKLTLRVMPAANAASPAKVTFYPFRENFIDHPAPQTLVRDGNGFRLAVKLVEPVASGVTTVSGVFVSESAWPGQPGRNAVELTLPVAAALPALAAPVGAAPGETGGSLALALVFALAGGLLLNLMPCVFPVLGIKVMGFVRHAHGNARALWMQGVVFSLGVLISFLVLAGLLLALRAAGTELGWGFQLQSPVFVTLLAALFLLMALNLFGLFELGLFAQSMTSELSATGRYADAFLAGVLATVVATPCTAPFMGAAVGFTLTQSATVSLAVFAMLGAGMALPVLALSFFPNALKKLPKPGPWMETFKQVMAFPLFATVIWLAWVLGAQAGNDALFSLLAGLLIVAIGAWIYGRWARSQSLARFVFAFLFVVAGLWIAWPQASASPASASPATDKAIVAKTGGIDWQPWSPERLAELRAAGTPVLVDFTAAWCVTCQVNKLVALNREEVVTSMARHGVVALKADWTNYDPRITEALAALGRNALPVYALYAPGQAQPTLLPEVLTVSIVVDALSKLPPARLAATTHPDQR